MDSRNLSLSSGHRTISSLTSLTGIHVCGRSTGAPLLFLLSPPLPPPPHIPHTGEQGKTSLSVVLSLEENGKVKPLCTHTCHYPEYPNGRYQNTSFPNT